MFMTCKKYWRIGLIVLVIGLLAFGGALTAFGTNEFEDCVAWDQIQGIDSEDCTKTGDGRDPVTGWLHWVWTSPGGDVANAKLYLYHNGDFIDEYDYYKGPPGAVHFMTPYFDLKDEDGEVILFAYVCSDEPVTGMLVLSDYCPGEQDATLEVEVNLDYEWTRDWDWDIEKSVFPDRWDLFVGDTGTSEYTVVVTRGEDVEESSLFGNFCVENIGSVEAENVVVTLDLYIDNVLQADEKQTFNLGNIAAGDEECDDFEFEDIELVDGAVYKVVMNVTLDNGGPYDDDDSVTARPDVQGIDEVTVTDSWKGELATGLTTSDTFTYTRTFACDSHLDDNAATEENGYWRYPNTVEIEETGDEDDAYVDVYCYELEIEKTAVTTFDREHEWDIDKYIETDNGYTIYTGEEIYPKIWLFIDGSGDETAYWNVCVTYLGFEDSDWAVSGTITITNPAPIDAVINSVEDVITAAGLDDIDAVIDFGEGEDEITFPYTLEAGEELVLPYSAELPDGTDRVNKAKAVQQNFDYTYDVYDEELGELQATASGTTVYCAEADVTFGDDPENEYLAVINIQDVSDFDFFGTQNLGTLDAAELDEDDVTCFEYDYFFKYGEYDGPAVINNTATIVETGQYASAILKINTQEFIYDSAWAKGEGSARDEAVDADEVVPFCEYFSNWGWTNKIGPGTYNWDLWAGAAQCDTSKGTLVGWVTVDYGVDGLHVYFHVYPEYDLKETHVYAGTTMFPQMQQGRWGLVDTVAPGQYYIEGDLSGEIYVIAHAVVGIPDPDFGPYECDWSGCWDAVTNGSDFVICFDQDNSNVDISFPDFELSNGKGVVVNNTLTGWWIQPADDDLKMSFSITISVDCQKFKGTATVEEYPPYPDFEGTVLSFTGQRQ